MRVDSATETGSLRITATRIANLIRAAVSYALFGLGILAFWSFLAPFVSLPTVAWYAAVLPPIHAPTEQQGVVVDAAPLIAGIVASVVAIWLR